MSNMARVDFTLHNALTRWEWSAFPLVVLASVLAVGIWYLRAEWALAARGRRWQPQRTASFLCGLLSVDIALQSPVATFTGTYFQAHVIQHLFLMVVAPPLLALGAPSTLLLQTSSRQTKEHWLAVLRSKPFAVISHPFTAWCLYFGVMFAFFLTSAVNVAMNHMALMDLINVVFLFGATLYWWPMVGIDPIIHWKMNHGARMLNILIGSAIEAFLGIAILAQSHPIASMYTLASTHSGGALLWVSTEFVTLLAFVPIFIQWMHAEDRIGARADKAAPRRDGAIEAPGAERAAAPERPHQPTAWELEWLARRGTVPFEQQAPPV
jgi:putative copper resistance protein D